MGLFDEIANRETGATDPNQRMSPAAERAMAADSRVSRAVAQANERGRTAREEARDRGQDPDHSIKTQDEQVTAQQARLGNLPEQQPKIDIMEVLTPNVFKILGTLKDTIFGNKVVGQSVLEKLKAAQEDPNKTIQDAINEMTNKEYNEYLQLQAKLTTPGMSFLGDGTPNKAFLDNTLFVDDEDTETTIRSLLEGSQEGIFGIDDPLVQNVRNRLLENPDLSFLESIGIGTPDEFMNQTAALKALGPRAVESLRVLNPEIYYGDLDEKGLGFKARTQQELEALAKMDIGSANKGLARAIADARMELRRNRNDGDRQQAGIPSIVTPPVTPPGAPQPPLVPFPPIAGLPISPGLGSFSQTPFNFSMFPQFNMSTYAQRGLADPNLSSYYQNLGRIA